jgi:hypothetical protein
VVLSFNLHRNGEVGLVQYLHAVSDKAWSK